MNKRAKRRSARYLTFARGQRLQYYSGDAFPALFTKLYRYCGTTFAASGDASMAFGRSLDTNTGRKNKKNKNKCLSISDSIYLTQHLQMHRNNTTVTRGEKRGLWYRGYKPISFGFVCQNGKKKKRRNKNLTNKLSSFTLQQCCTADAILFRVPISSIYLFIYFLIH